MARERSYTTITTQHLNEVARIYRNAYKNGHPPTSAVHSQFGCGRSTAERWVRLARNAGLLPSTDARKNLTRHPRALAVAKELGISYDRLVTAVEVHAHGDLRLHSR